jgi:hypothetical protein
MHRRTALLVAASAAAIATSFAPSATAKRQRRRPRMVSVETPVGMQGVSGSGPNVVIPFTVADDRHRPVDIEVQYAVDYDANGNLSDYEYRPATEDRLDWRDTRSDAEPQLFTTSSEGVVHGFVWKSLDDIGPAIYPTLEYALTPQGRPVPDPDNPGSYLFATGPNGWTPIFSGVRLRFRPVVRRHGRRHWIYGRWVWGDTFAINNRRAPSMRFDSLTSGSTVLVNWTAFDADSEDKNGNGVLDLADGEDRDADGVLDDERVGIAFDFHIVGDGEDPASLTDWDLAYLSWIECERVQGVGDTDSLDARPGVPIPATGDLAGVASAPAPVGRHWVFAWSPEQQIGTTSRGFILRATPFDQARARGETVYSRTIVYEQE